MIKNIILRALIAFMAIYLIVLAYINYNQRKLLYNPQKDTIELAEINFPGVEEIFLTSKDGIKIQAWYSKPEDKNKMVIFYHGNFGNISHRLEKLKELKKLGYGFIIPAWRGFGKSEGVPSEEGIYHDARATVEFIQNEGYNSEDIILIGESLGSGVATKMATENKFKGLVLITPYTTICDRASEIYFYLPVKYLLKDNFDNINNIQNVTVPLLIIHGDKDDIIPHHHSIKIIERANDPKKLIIYPDKNHTDYNIKEVLMEMDIFFNNNNISKPNNYTEEEVAQN